MLIGILETDSLDDDTRRKFGSYADMFCRLLTSVDTTITFKIYQTVNNEFPRNFDECDAYLITGSKFSAYDDIAWIIKLKQFIQTLDEHKQPLIGICFGHQIIAEALGGKVLKSHKGWGLGTMAYTVVAPPAWMQPAVDHFKLIISHHDQVHQLPPRARLMAANDFCPVAAFHIDMHILTFQGHPEFTSEFAQHLMELLVPPPAPEILQRAGERLKEKTDHLLVAQWILDFICQSVGKK